jgi:oligoendopeptidase F
LDSQNGRLDLSGGAHRARTGTSISAYDAPVAFYYEGYHGTLESVSVIAHEGGHAIHRELMNASGIPVYERTGPHYLFEGFAMFNELLLLDHAIDVAKLPRSAKMHWRAFSGTSRMRYLPPRKRRPLSVVCTPKLVDILCWAGPKSIPRIGIQSLLMNTGPMSDVGASYYWMRKSLLFQDPLYEVNYLYAALVAVALYDRSHSDPEFVAKYEALLSRGFYAKPQALLATMNISLDDPALVKSASSLFQTKTEELERLYQDEGKK